MTSGWTRRRRGSCGMTMARGARARRIIMTQRHDQGPPAPLFALIDQPEKWTQHALRREHAPWREESGTISKESLKCRVQRCALGAIMDCQSEEVTESVEGYQIHSIIAGDKRIRGYYGGTDPNTNPNAPTQEVMQAFDRAIEDAQ